MNNTNIKTDDVINDCKPTYKRQISIQAVYQESTDCFVVRISLHAPNWLDDGYEIDVIMNADQLFDYREFQKETFRQFGIIPFVPDVDEFDGASWIQYILSCLTFYIGGEA